MLPLSRFAELHTPFYYYDLDVLNRTLNCVKSLAQARDYRVHYAIKANSNPVILKHIAGSGLGADLVSSGELKVALEAGFDPSKMMFAGVGKTDEEISLALKHHIACFNVESVPELQVIDSLAREMNTIAPVALRVNPDIDAHTHAYITTATAHNKFGIAIEDLPQVVEQTQRLPNLRLMGLHFHLGSQITIMEPFQMLCHRVNELLTYFEDHGVHFTMMDMGGGLGIDYSQPESMAPFEQFFDVFSQNLNLRQGQQLHFELGRALVAQCGSLISRVVFVKENRDKKFVILDAGMTQLIRPALYQAHHKIENLTAKVDDVTDTYDVVGPVCESSDVFAHDEMLPVTHRGDVFAIRSAGAYGESMASHYNMRELPLSQFSR